MNVYRIKIGRGTPEDCVVGFAVIRLYDKLPLYYLTTAFVFIMQLNAKMLQYDIKKLYESHGIGGNAGRDDCN